MTLGDFGVIVDTAARGACLSDPRAGRLCAPVGFPSRRSGSRAGEALHPFTDGNGRIGRPLAILQLIEAGILDTPVVNLSPYFETRRDQYIGLLKQVSATGAWNEWITFFCDALASQAADGALRIRELLDWRDSTLASLRDAGVRGTAHNVIDQFISQPMTTARAISDRHGVSASAANHALKRLLEMGIVQEITGKPYARVYAATGLLYRPSP